MASTNKGDFIFDVDKFGTLTVTDMKMSLGTDVISSVETLSFNDGDLTVTTLSDGSVTLTGTSVDDYVKVENNNLISGLSAEYYTNTGSDGNFDNGTLQTSRIDSTIDFQGDWDGGLPSASGDVNNTFFVSNTEVVRAGGGDDVVMIRDDLATALYGEAGNDILYGNAADNRVDGGSGRDQLFGGLGEDALFGGDGTDHVSGGSGDDQISGDGGTDTLTGGTGDDTIAGGLGDDVIDGGADTDIATYSGKMADYKVEIGLQGIDKVIDLKAEDGDDGTDRLSAVETVRFTDGELTVSFDADGEAQVNTYPFYDQQTPAIANLSGGGYVVTWQDSSGGQHPDGGSGWDIRAQVYGEDGIAVGSGFLVNSYTSSTQDYPSVTGLVDGGFVVTWEDSSGHSGGSSTDIRGQRFDQAGAAVGPEFMVNTETDGHQYNPSVASLSDGGFVVTWRDNHGGNREGGNQYDIRAQQYDKDGTPAGGEFLVNETMVSGYQYNPEVTGLKDGGFAIAWRNDSGSDHKDDDVAGSAIDVWARVFKADGSEAVGEFRVNTDQFSGNQYEPEITGLDNGGFVVTWFDTSGGSHDDGTGAGSGYDIWAHAYNADGTEITSEFRVNTDISGHQYNPSIATLSDGGFVVTWNDGEIHGQRFDASGTTVGEPFQVNTWTSGSQSDSTVTGLDNGGFVVSWTSQYQDGSNTGIFSQRFDANGTAISTVRLTGSADNDIVSFVDPQKEMIVDLGGGDQDTLTLGDQADSIRVEGVENVTLGGGDDVVRVEGAGTATIDGGAGDDTYIVNNDGVRIVEAAGEGQDTVISNADSYTLDDNVETLQLGEDGTAAIGNAGDNQILGNQGDNTLEGGAGNDTLTGGGGDDILDGDGGTDLAVFEGAFADYTPSVEAGVFHITANSGDGASDALYGIETLRFADGEYRVAGDATTTTLTNVADANDVTTVAGGITVTAFDAPTPTASAATGAAASSGSAQTETAATTETTATAAASTASPGASLQPVTTEEARLNAWTSHTQSEPSMASLGDGKTVVVWQSLYQAVQQGISGADWTWDVYGQIFGPTGTPMGDEFLVNSYLGNSQYEPAVSTLTDGSFVVTWRDDSGLPTESGGSGGDIVGQRVDGNGEKSGGDFRINTETSGTQYAPSLSALDNGGFAVTWADADGSNHSGSGYDIRAQRFNADSTPAGDEILVNPETVSGDQTQPAITTLANGNFVVTWRDESGTDHKDDDVAGDGHDIWARVFKADGTEAVSEFRINEDTLSGNQYEPAIAALSNGSFVVTWRDDGGSS
ncbi:MAG: hypothetical protein VX411_05080, partial [Pseudomonadota bacterium]|nr:hypothetical protein [Pseudomonadota bacterium]